MKISVAQIRSIKGDVILNIQSHKKLIKLAIDHKADVIFFPELSITNYEPELAGSLATNQKDQRFDDFQRISNENRIVIGVGMPTEGTSGIQISMIIFRPEEPRQTYSKQKLHTDETSYFTEGDKQVILKMESVNIALAICYESLQADHSQLANRLGANVYMASVAKSQSGVDKAMTHYPAIAKKYSMPVLMSNCIGPCDNFNSVGKTSVWTKQGFLAGQLDSEHEGILVFDTQTEEVINRIL